MTPEELEAMKKQIDQINAIDDPEHFRPTADAIDTAAAEYAMSKVSRRDPGLVRAELLDALDSYSEIFRDKAAMELERFEAVRGIINRVQSGLEFEQADIEMKTANEWIQRYRLLDMRFQEMQMRVNRLILEHGTNNGMA